MGALGDIIRFFGVSLRIMICISVSVVSVFLGVGLGIVTAVWNYGKSIKKNLIDSIFSS